MPRLAALALALPLAAALPAAAATVGQPFLIVDAAAGGAPTGSILDFFDDFGPSGVKEVSLSGTVTEGIGLPSAVGKTLSFSTQQPPGDAQATLTFGTTVIDGFNILASLAGDYDYDPFLEGPGDLNFAFFVIPPVEEVGPLDPNGTFVYGGDFAGYPDRDADIGYPDFELILSVYLSAPLPTKFYDAPDDDPFGDFDYIEGPLSISRFTLGYVGGAPLPDTSPIPVPAGLPLLAGGLMLLGGVRRRRRR